MLKKLIATTSILPLMTFGLTAAPAFADDTISVNNSSSASVSNNVVVAANTGYNVAHGGNGGDGGDGGSASSRNFRGDTVGGEGGAGGTGGDGGLIVTGDATAEVNISNDVNNNRTSVEGACGCDEEWEESSHKRSSEESRGERRDHHDDWDNDWRSGDRGRGSSKEYEEDHWKKYSKGSDDEITVENDFNADVENNVAILLNTGYNFANGGEGGDGGDGAEASADNRDSRRRGHHGHHGDNHGNFDPAGGDGGEGGDGGFGGDIRTGEADSKVDIVNVVNRNVTRVRH